MILMMMMMTWMDGKYQLPNQDTKHPKPSERTTSSH